MATLAGRFWHGRQGASMVEFALLLPVLLLLATGVWEFGRIYDAALVATNAAREGARWAALGRSEAEVQTRVAQYMVAGYGNRLASGELTVGLVDVTTSGVSGDPVTVEVPVAVAIYMPFLPNLVPGIPNPMPLAGRATMRLQTGSAP